jgi:hypothetical protein
MTTLTMQEETARDNLSKDMKKQESFITIEQITHYLKVDNLPLPSGDQQKRPGSA